MRVLKLDFMTGTLSSSNDKILLHSMNACTVYLSEALIALDSFVNITCIAFTYDTQTKSYFKTYTVYMY